MKVVAIALGGALGALMRFWVSGIPHKYFSGSFPWGTFTVNIVGSFFIGFLWVLNERFVFSPNLRLCVFTGILGAFTTFSAYSMETYNLMRTGENKVAFCNVFFSIIIGVFAVYGGIIIARAIFVKA